MWKVSSLCNLRFALLNMATVAGRADVQPQRTAKHGWMARYFNSVGDHMPHTRGIHLPSWNSQKFAFARYRDDTQSACASGSHQLPLEGLF